MAQIYTNGEKFQGSFLVNGMNPLDPRHQLQGLDSIFMDATKFAAKGGLFNIAYRGMTVVVYDDDNVPTQLILNDPAPYTPAASFDSALVVNATTYTNFWTIVGQDIKDEIAGDVSAHFHQLDVSVNKNEQRIKTIDTSLATGKYKYYDDAYVNAQNVATVTDHGNIKKGTTVADLMQMNISEILSDILFEIAEPVRIQEAYTTVAWKSGSKYTSVVDVNTPWPAASEIVVTYHPEQYQWTSADGAEQGEVVDTTNKGTTTVIYNTDTTSWASETASEGTTGPFHATVAAVAGSNAVDSRNSDKRKNGTYYRKASDAATEVGTKDSLNAPSGTKSLSFTAAYRFASNATKTFSSAASALAAKNVAPGNFTGNDVIKVPTASTESYALVSGNTKNIWLQWPQLDEGGTVQQVLHVYVPNSYTISEVKQAANFSDAFNVNLSFSQSGTKTVSYTAGGVNVSSDTYKNYVIEANKGITTVHITLNKA